MAPREVSPLPSPRGGLGEAACASRKAKPKELYSQELPLSPRENCAPHCLPCGHRADAIAAARQEISTTPRSLGCTSCCDGGASEPAGCQRHANGASSSAASSRKSGHLSTEMPGAIISHIGDDLQHREGQCERIEHDTTPEDSVATPTHRPARNRSGAAHPSSRTRTQSGVACHPELPQQAAVEDTDQHCAPPRSPNGAATCRGEDDRVIATAHSEQMTGLARQSNAWLSPRSVQVQSAQTSDLPIASGVGTSSPKLAPPRYTGQRDLTLAPSTPDLVREVPLKALAEFVSKRWQQDQTLELPQFHLLMVDVQRISSRRRRITTTLSERSFRWMDADADGEVSLADFLQGERELREANRYILAQQELHRQARLDARRFHLTKSCERRRAETLSRRPQSATRHSKDPHADYDKRDSTHHGRSKQIKEPSWGTSTHDTVSLSFNPIVRASHGLWPDGCL